MIIDHGGTGLFIFGVGIARANASIPFDNDLMTALDELIDAGGEQSDAIFLNFIFLGKKNNNKFLIKKKKRR
jgi:hypothetical protein